MRRDTRFADMAAAYEALPEEMRRRLDGLQALQQNAGIDGGWTAQ